MRRRRKPHLGSLVAYITDARRKDFQPMNANFGLMPELGGRGRGRAKKIELAARALAAIDDWIAQHQLAIDPPVTAAA